MLFIRRENILLLLSWPIAYFELYIQQSTIKSFENKQFLLKVLELGAKKSLYHKFFLLICGLYILYTNNIFILS